MSFVGGDIVEISYKHAIIGSGVWFPKSGEDGTLDKGGLRKTDDANMKTASGVPIWQMNNVMGGFETVVGWDMSVSDELSQAEKLAASPVETDFTITHINGTIFGGRGSVVGDIQGNTNTAQMSVKIAVDKWTKIS